MGQNPLCPIHWEACIGTCIYLPSELAFGQNQAFCCESPSYPKPTWPQLIGIVKCAEEAVIGKVTAENSVIRHLKKALEEHKTEWDCKAGNIIQEFKKYKNGVMDGGFLNAPYHTKAVMAAMAQYHWELEGQLKLELRAVLKVFNILSSTFIDHDSHRVWKCL